MTNVSKIAIGACALMLGTAPAMAQMEAKTTQTEKQSTATTSEHSEKMTTAAPTHRKVVHKRVVRHHPAKHAVKKTMVETHTTTETK